MAYMQGADRGQGFLLPASVEDYVGPEHPVRAIDAFVEALDLGCIGFAKAVPAATGRPPYAPGDLLKLYLVGLLQPGELQPAAGGHRRAHRRVPGGGPGQ